MFSSALRRAHIRLRSSCRGGSCTAGVSLPLPTATTNSSTDSLLVRPFVFVSSRSINSRGAIAIDSLRKNPITLARNARFSSSGESEETTDNPIASKLPLLLDVDENLPEIYMSPSALVERISHHQIVPSGCESISLQTEGKDEPWHTATYTDKRTDENFHSGKLGQFLNKIGESNGWEIPSFSSEEARVEDGKVYYRSESSAKEAAASRVLDCLAFRLKYSDLSVLADNEAFDLEPVRYCAELPFLLPMPGENASSKMDHWPCLMAILTSEGKVGNAALATNGVIFGTIFADEGVGTGKVFDCTPSINYDGVWFTSTLVDNEISDEAFRSSIMRVNPELNRPCKLRVDDDGTVHYKGDIRFALDSASARAIDCYNFRNKQRGDEDLAQLCYERPYTAEKGPSRSTIHTILEQRGEILKMVQRNKIAKAKAKAKASKTHDETITFSSYAIARPHVLHFAKEFLLNVFRRRSIQGYDIKFVLHSVQLNAKFYSATFTDPITKEVFRSGLGGKVRVERHPRVNTGPPLHLVEAKIVDGKVYYRTKKLAEHAAAARAIDCYIFRENPIMIGVDPKRLRLCLEDPYGSESERDDQRINYDALMAKRAGNVKKKAGFSDRPRHRKRKKYTTLE